MNIFLKKPYWIFLLIFSVILAGFLFWISATNTSKNITSSNVKKAAADSLKKSNQQRRTNADLEKSSELNETFKSEDLDVIYTDVLEFVGLEQNGDNDLLIAIKGKDTLTFICDFSTPVKLERGDRIRLQWKRDLYVPAGDPEFPVEREFALDFSTLEYGKLSKLIMKKGLPILKPSVEIETVSEYGRSIIEYNLKYYLANASDHKVRRFMALNPKDLIYNTEKRTINGSDVLELSLLGDPSGRNFLKKVYFAFERPFSVLEYDDLF